MTKDELIALRRERGKQELNIGDRVKVYDQDGEALYSGKAFEIIGKSKYNSGFIYSLHGLMSPFTAELLELVKEPTDEIKVGDRVETSCGVFIVDMIAGINIFGHYENGDAGIWTKKELKRCINQPDSNTITIPVEANFGEDVGFALLDRALELQKKYTELEGEVKRLYDVILARQIERFTVYTPFNNHNLSLIAGTLNNFRPLTAEERLQQEAELKEFIDKTLKKQSE